MTDTITTRTYDLTVVFTDMTVQTFPAIDSHWCDDNVLRLRCRDSGKSTVYTLPLVGIRLWHRELT